MKFLALILVCFLPFYISAQANIVKGHVIADSIKLKGVNVINLSNDEGTISNEDGFFYIKSRIGDTLLFTHVGMSSLKKKFLHLIFNLILLLLKCRRKL